MFVGLRAPFRCATNRAPRWVLFSSNPDWDINALNDEMEGLIGKFDDSRDDSCGILDSTASFLPSSAPTSRKQLSTPTTHISHTPVHRVAPKVKAEVTCSVSSTGRPSYTVFHFDPDISEKYISDAANLTYKSWIDFSSLEALMTELSDDNSRGVIFLQRQSPFQSTMLITPLQKTLLKIYKKSSPVVLVIGSEGRAIDESVAVLSGNGDDHHHADESFASCVIQGFTSQHGIAAAVAGINSSIGFSTM